MIAFTSFKPSFTGTNSEGGAGGLVGNAAAEEVIVVTDTYEHADRIEAYRRVAGVTTMIEVKASLAVEA